MICSGDSPVTSETSFMTSNNTRFESSGGTPSGTVSLIENVFDFPLVIIQSVTEWVFIVLVFIVTRPLFLFAEAVPKASPRLRRRSRVSLAQLSPRHKIAVVRSGVEETGKSR